MSTYTSEAELIAALQAQGLPPPGVSVLQYAGQPPIISNSGSSASGIVTGTGSTAPGTVIIQPPAGYLPPGQVIALQTPVSSPMPGPMLGPLPSGPGFVSSSSTINFAILFGLFAAASLALSGRGRARKRKAKGKRR